MTTNADGRHLPRTVARAAFRRVADSALGPVEVRLDQHAEQLRRLSEAMAALAAQVADLDSRIERSTGELVRLMGDQVDGANDANEALGRVLAGLRSELAGLTEALDSARSGGKARKR